MTIRTRTRGSLSDGHQVYLTVAQNGVQTSYDQYLPALQVGETQTTHDRVTPNFHARKAAGEIINNPFESISERRWNSFSGGQIEDTWAMGYQIRHYVWDYGYYIPPISGTASSFEQQKHEACTEAAARVESTAVDGLVEVAEARETMRLFHLGNLRLLRQLQKEYRFAKRKGWQFRDEVGDLKRVVAGSTALTRVAANNWLMLRYGVTPAIRTMNDVLVVGSKIQTRRETSRGSAATGDNGIEAFPRYYGGFNSYADWTKHWSWEANVRAGILYERRNFTNRYGFSLANVPAAIWEATTLSFVVDWVLNTGDFIRALTPRTQSTRRATWYGWHLTVDEQYYTSAVFTDPRFTVHKAQTGVFARRLEYRKRLPTLLSPSLFIRENALREIATSPRIVDAFALTTQLLFKLLTKTKAGNS